MWVWGSSLLRSQIFTEAKWFYSLQLYSQTDWAECSISLQNLGRNEKLTPGVMGRSLRDDLVAATYKSPITLCSGGGMPGILPKLN